MAGPLRAGFQDGMLTLPLTSITPQRAIPVSVKKSSVFRQIRSSIMEVGLIEPVVVFPQDSKGFLLLDGHLRIEVLKELSATEVKVILSTDDEAYTYNKRVNHIPPVAQHFMLLQALNNGVPEERIAKALNVNVAAVRQRAKLLDGICPEVIELLRDRKVSPALFSILRKMKPAIQIATAELMALRNDFSVSFAKTRLALTPADLLLSPVSPKHQADADTVRMLMEEDTENLVRTLKRIEDSYGADILTMTVSCAFIEKLLQRPAVTRYLERFHNGVLGTLHGLLREFQPPGKHTDAA